MLDFFDKHHHNYNSYVFSSKLRMLLKANNHNLVYRHILDHNNYEWIQNLRKTLISTSKNKNIYLTCVHNFFLPLAIYLSHIPIEFERSECKKLTKYIKLEDHTFRKRRSNVFADRIIDLFISFGLIKSAQYFIKFKLSNYPKKELRKVDNVIISISQNEMLTIASKIMPYVIHSHQLLNLEELCKTNISEKAIVSLYTSNIIQVLISSEIEQFIKKASFEDLYTLNNHLQNILKKNPRTEDSLMYTVKEKIIFFANIFINSDQSVQEQCFNLITRVHKNDYQFLAGIAEYLENSCPYYSNALKQEAEKLIFNPFSLQNITVYELDTWRTSSDAYQAKIQPYIS